MSRKFDVFKCVNFCLQGAKSIKKKYKKKKGTISRLPNQPHNTNQCQTSLMMTPTTKWAKIQKQPKQV